MSWTFVLTMAIGTQVHPGLTEIECLAMLRVAPMYVAEQGATESVSVSCVREDET